MTVMFWKVYPNIEVSLMLPKECLLFNDLINMQHLYNSHTFCLLYTSYSESYCNATAR